MKELYSDNLAKFTSAADEIFKEEQDYKKNWARVAKRCVAFANGDQNPTPQGAPVMVNNQPVQARVDNRGNTYQTNEIEPIIRTLTSYMTRSRPAIEANAAGETDEDKAIARVAEKVAEAKYDLDNEYQHSRMAAFWSLAVATIFRKDYWDYSLGYYVPQVDIDGQQVGDETTGEPVYSDQKTGNNAVGILTALSVTVDHSIMDFYRMPYVAECYVMDVDWAREAFDQNLPGYTGKAKDIKEDGYIADTIQTFEEMKFAVPYFSSGKVKSKGKCLIREWCVRPNREYPQGRLIIQAGSETVYMTPPGGDNPYFNPFEPIMWHGMTSFTLEPYIGRFLGKSIVEQLVPLQMRLNEINGAILENANTLAKPNLTAVEGQLKKGITNGRGANIYTYRLIPGAPAPSAVAGIPLPQQFFNEKQQIIDQMVRIAGTNFVMSGQTPTGVTAASAINQLLENASSQQSDMMLAWQRFHEEAYTKKLRLIHKFNKFPDQSLNRRLRMITQETNEFQTMIFIGARDLSDGVNVKIQSGSMIPKSQAVKNDGYKELAQANALSPYMMEDSPRGEKIRQQVMEKMGLEPLDSEESSDYKKAKWENVRMMRGEPVMVERYDNAAVHLPIHIAKRQDPRFLESATEEQINTLDNHIAEHEAIEQQKQMAQMPQDPSQMVAPEGMPPEAMAQGPQELAGQPATLQ